MSRPEKPIDWKKVDDFLIAGCLGNEVAAYFDMHPNTFYDRVVSKYNMSFTEYQSSKRSHGEALLRAVQYAKAIGTTKDGDNTMLIWLGKNRLGQKDGQMDINFNNTPDNIIKAIEEKKQVIE